MSAPPLVLASGSPRRRQLLGELGLELVVRPVDIDETPRPGEPAEAYVLRLAREKAAAAARPHELVLAADTTVALGGELLGKPADEAEARRMLERLSGRDHRVLTGVALVEPGGGRRETVETTRVRFAELSGEEIAWYAASGEPLDKAGAYAVQGLGAIFVESIEGSHSNVVGLPLVATYRLLRAAGYPVLETISRNGSGRPGPGGRSWP